MNTETTADDESGTNDESKGFGWLAWLALGLGIIFGSSYLEAIKHEGLVPLFGEDHAKLTEWILHATGKVAHELGVALLVAVFVGLLIEAGHRKGIANILRSRTEALVKKVEIENRQSKEAINRDIFAGVFKKRLPSGYVEQVLDAALDTPLVRRDFEISYVLRDLTDEENPTGENGYIIVECAVSFYSENISNKIVPLPKAFSLPNPQNTALLGLCKVTNIRSGETKAVVEPLASEALDKANESLQAGFQKGTTNGSFMVEGFEIEPGQGQHLVFDYQLVKEAEDNESFRSSTPTSGMVVRVVDQTTSRELRVEAEAITGSDLSQSHSNDAQNGVRTFTCKDWLLPHQGIIVFWKKHNKTREER